MDKLLQQIDHFFTERISFFNRSGCPQTGILTSEETSEQLRATTPTLVLIQDKYKITFNSTSVSDKLAGPQTCLRVFPCEIILLFTHGAVFLGRPLPHTPACLIVRDLDVFLHLTPQVLSTSAKVTRFDEVCEPLALDAYHLYNTVGL